MTSWPASPSALHLSKRYQSAHFAAAHSYARATPQRLPPPQQQSPIHGKRDAALLDCAALAPPSLVTLKLISASSTPRPQ